MFKHKYKILISLVSIAVLTTIGAFLYFKFIAGPLFEARATLLVKFGWEQRGPDVTLESGRSATMGAADIVNSEVEILQSRDLKEKVIKAVGLENMYPALAGSKWDRITQMEIALLNFEQSLIVKPAKKGNIVEVSFTGPNPAMAAKALNQLIGFYIDKRIEAYKDPKSILFLEKKAEEYRQKFADSESRLTSFQKESAIFSFDEQRTLLLNQRTVLDSNLKTTQIQVQENQQKFAELDRQLKAIPKNTLSTGASDRIGSEESRLLTLQLQEKDLLAKYKEDNRLVVNVRNQIQMVKDYLEKQRSRNAGPGVASPDPIYQDIQRQMIQAQAELSALKVRSTGLEAQIHEADAEMQKLDSLANRFKVLKMQVVDNEEKYKSYQKKLEEARVYDELERQKMTSVSVIEPPAVPAFPIKQKPFMLFVALGLACGLGGGVALAFMLESLQQGLITPQDAERRLAVPVLATIPYKS